MIATTDCGCGAIGRLASVLAGLGDYFIGGRPAARWLCKFGDSRLAELQKKSIHILHLPINYIVNVCVHGRSIMYNYVIFYLGGA